MADIVLQEEYPHPPARVWRMLTDPVQLARWLMPNDFVAEAGREFTMTTRPAPGFDGIIHGQVLELDPPRRMRWAWRVGTLRTTVTFELTALDTGTRLILRHEGFTGLPGMLPWLLMRGGWKKKLRRRITQALAQDA